MNETYDKYYQTLHLFGEPHPELIEFFAGYPQKGKILDLGCGQGRDAIALARLGYTVTGIDNSKVGIDQMNAIAQAENLSLTGQIGDIYSFDPFDKFDIVLLDSMFHFAKKDKDKEIRLLQKISSTIKKGSLVVVCLQDTGTKIQTLKQALHFEQQLTTLADQKFVYTFEDKESGHQSKTNYRMIVVEK